MKPVGFRVRKLREGPPEERVLRRIWALPAMMPGGERDEFPWLTRTRIPSHIQISPFLLFKYYDLH